MSGWQVELNGTGPCEAVVVEDRARDRTPVETDATRMSRPLGNWNSNEATACDNGRP